MPRETVSTPIAVSPQPIRGFRDPLSGPQQSYGRSVSAQTQRLNIRPIYPLWTFAGCRSSVSRTRRASSRGT
jgi:hypothetical protein